MILNKKQITRIENAFLKAENLQNKAQIASGRLCKIIEEETGIKGNVDYLQGDGHGFTPESNDDVHIWIPDLIRLAKDGKDIDEELMYANFSI